MPLWISQSQDLVAELDQDMMYVCVNAVCHLECVGETGRSFQTRSAEHCRQLRVTFGHGAVAKHQYLRAKNVEMWVPLLLFHDTAKFGPQRPPTSATNRTCNALIFRRPKRFPQCLINANHNPHPVTGQLVSPLGTPLTTGIL